MATDDDRDDVDDGWDGVELDAETMRGLLDDLIAEITTNADPLEAWDGVSQAVPLALALDDADTARRVLAHAATLTEDGFATLFTARLVQLEVLVGAATDDEALVESALDRLAALDGFDETVSATWIVVARQLLQFDRPADAVDTCWRAVTVAQGAADDRPALAALTIGHAADAVEDAGDRSSALVLTEVALDLLAARRERLDTDPIAHELEAPAEADGRTIEVVYLLDNGLTTSQSTITLRTAEPFNNPPVVFDAYGASNDSPAVKVDVLRTAYDPDGPTEELRITDVFTPPGAVASVNGGKITVTRGDVPMVVPFRVVDADGGAAIAQLYVPPRAGNLPFVKADAVIRLAPGQSDRVRLDDYIVSPGDLPLRLPRGE